MKQNEPANPRNIQNDGNAICIRENNSE